MDWAIILAMLAVSALVLLDSVLVWRRSLANVERLERSAVAWTDLPVVRNPRFLILIPMYQEVSIAANCFSEFLSAFGHRRDCTVVFITSIMEISEERQSSFLECMNREEFVQYQNKRCASTPEAVHNLLLKLKKQNGDYDTIHHVVNVSTNARKYAQLEFALDYWAEKFSTDDFVAVYDADSRPDPMVVEFILRYPGRARVFQQPGIFPPRCDSPLSRRLSQARALLNLHFMLDKELTGYFCSERDHGSRRGIAYANHLTGHGEFIQFRSLNLAGGFRSPSCDTTLGYSLSILGQGIVAVPFVDVGTTPSSLSGIFWQGVVWFNGVRLYPREVARTGVRWTCSRGLALLRRVRDNARWGTYPFAVLITIIIGFVYSPLISFFALTSIILAYSFRDYIGWKLYRRMLVLTSRPPVKAVSLRQWMMLSIGHVTLTRWLWAVPPWYVHACRLIQREPSLRKTRR